MSAEIVQVYKYLLCFFHEVALITEKANPALLSSRHGYLLELTGWTKGSQASVLNEKKKLLICNSLPRKDTFKTEVKLRLFQ